MLDARDLPVVDQYAAAPDPPGSVEFLEMSKQIMENNNLIIPNTVERAIELYIVLTTTIELQN